MIYFSESHSKSDRVLPTRIPFRFKANSNRLRPSYYLHPTTYPLLPTKIPAAYSLLPAMPTCYLLPTACYLLPGPNTCIALDLLTLPAPYCICCGQNGQLLPVPLNMAPWRHENTNGNSPRPEMKVTNEWDTDASVPKGQLMACPRIKGPWRLEWQQSSPWRWK